MRRELGNGWSLLDAVSFSVGLIAALIRTPLLIDAVSYGIKPERLAESSRWSQRSVDHRKTASDLHPHPGGVPLLSDTPFRVENYFLIIRWSTLRCNHRKV